MTKKIVIESMYLFNYNHPEKGVVVGGTQRYSLDLGLLFHKLGFEVTFLTKACRKYVTYYDNWAKIIAFNSLYGSKGNFDFSLKVYKYCNQEKPKLAIYSDLQIGYPFCYSNSFAIQHGISWDNPMHRLGNLVKLFFYKKAVNRFRKIICVDTNFINWYRERSKHYFRNPQNLVYIPNYADENQFSYEYRHWEPGSTFKLLYPRRLVPHRGFDIFMDMCKELIKKGYKIEPVLAFEDFRNEEFIKKFPQYVNMNCTVVHPNMNQIHSLYKDAFLTFIPTKWSEGTSLSAIESLSSGCPVIASDVGGLGNIILPGFNGYIIPPTVKEFVKITEMLINDVNKRNELSKNCRKMKQVFGKSRWEEQIINAINMEDYETTI